LESSYPRLEHAASNPFFRQVPYWSSPRAVQTHPNFETGLPEISGSLALEWIQAIADEFARLIPDHTRAGYQ
jgi:hypothetical protein